MSAVAKQWIITASIIVSLYAGLQPSSFFFSRPHGDHAWAQCDRASVALNFHRFHYSILQPHAHSIAFNPTGIAPGEFPLVPFLVAWFYDLFGFHEYLFRLMTLIFSLVGFVFAYLLAKRYLRTVWLQTTAATVWLLSPNLIYYSFGFLPDCVALSCFIASFYYITHPKGINFVRAILLVLFASLSVLLKSSVLFLLLPLALSLIVSSHSQQKFKLKSLFILAVSICVGITWLVYARHLQQQHNSPIFKLSMVLPQNTADVIACLRQFAAIVPELYPWSIVIVLSALFVFVVKNFRVGNQLHVFTFSAIAAWIFFCVLMMRNACHHGYYHVPFQFTVFTLLLCTFQLIETRNLVLPKVRLVGLMALLLVSFIAHSFTLQRISSHHNLIHTDWNDVEPTLREAGIQPLDPVFSYYDISYNISLYLMNQRGWACMKDVRDSYKASALEQCRYAVLNDTAIVHNASLEQYFGLCLARHKALYVYELQH